MIQYKETKKLFFGIYAYKIVLNVGLYMYCYKNWYENRKDLMKLIRHNKSRTTHRAFASYVSLKPLYQANQPMYHGSNVRFIISVYKVLRKMTDFKIMNEYQRVTIYSNDYSDIEKLASISEQKVMYVCKPTVQLESDNIVLKNSNYAYRVKLTVKYDIMGFIAWAMQNKNFGFSAPYSKIYSGGFRKYPPPFIDVKDEKNLMLIKMQIGPSIQKIERIINN